MKKRLSKDSLLHSLTLPVVFVVLLWVIQSASVLFDLSLNTFGIKPLTLQGLLGIFTAPLVHGSYEHLFHNTLPLIVLGSALIYGYPVTRLKALVFSWLFSGIGVWLMGRPAVHLGASGVSHGLFFYLFVVAIMRRDTRSVGLMMIAFFLYGGMVMTIFPRDPAISYEAHFFGALGGAIAALLFGTRDPKPVRKRYAWENTDDQDPVIGDQWQGGEVNAERQESDGQHHRTSQH
ncbi:rhomboid family intramembrane serine protease [Aestuariibacter sp. A3R04]|uniref:rhomboid family intramembrane serine protease n=1 Tax=Aestuariibacter sp. A3R04 TaxID=2841571 RepID=UPI001C07F615|nr:rhomboid family intramembrane serine protease [Aestuariibacter sp. A3R04]MBU3022777.1 rhomboid family intramembrane serine protease [Aestuariibacter sp. A3R04]